MEVKEVQSKFKPRLVQFNQEGYDQQCKIAQQKLELLEKGKQLALEHIKEVKLKEFANDMVSYLQQEIIKANAEMKKLKLSDDKILYLLDKEKALKNLEAIQIQFESINLSMNWRNDEPNIKVSKEDYSKFTKSEEQNEKLQAFLDVIIALENLTQYVKVYKGDVANVTSQAIRGDFRTNKLTINPRFFE